MLTSQCDTIYGSLSTKTAAELETTASWDSFYIRPASMWATWQSAVPDAVAHEHRQLASKIHMGYVCSINLDKNTLQDFQQPITNNWVPILTQAPCTACSALFVTSLGNMPQILHENQKAAAMLLINLLHHLGLKR